MSRIIIISNIVSSYFINIVLFVSLVKWSILSFDGCIVISVCVGNVGIGVRVMRSGNIFVVNISVSVRVSVICCFVGGVSGVYVRLNVFIVSDIVMERGSWVGSVRGVGISGIRSCVIFEWFLVCSIGVVIMIIYEY